MKERRYNMVRWTAAGLLIVTYLNGCSINQSQAPNRSPDRAYIDYWPAPHDSNQLRLAVKDNIDIKGVVTSAGSEYLARNSPPASRDADCLTIARQRHVRIIGKTNLSEFAVAPSEQYQPNQIDVAGSFNIARKELQQIR